MKKVIFKKGDKTITVPWFICCYKSKIKSLYRKDGGIIVFDEEVTDITFDKCNYEGNFYIKLLDHQKLNLVKCSFKNDSYATFNEICIYGGHLVIDDSTFIHSHLSFQDGKSANLNFSNNTNLRDIRMIASKINITNNVRSDYLNISSNSLNILNTDISSHIITARSSEFSIENSVINSSSTCNLCYQNLKMKNISLSTNSDFSFYKVISGDFMNLESLKYECVSTYHHPTNLKDTDILSEKNQAIYSFLSILKGVNENIKNKNSNEFAYLSSKLDDSCYPRLEEIDKQIELLQQERDMIIDNTDYNKERVREILSNRQIKSLTYPKR